MSVKVVFGKTYSVVRESVALDIEKNMSLDIKNYVILPDSSVSVCKKELLKLFKQDSFFNVKILSLTALSKELFKTDKKTISKEQGLLLFKKIVNDKKDELKAFNKITNNDGAVKKLFDAVNSLAESDITPQKLSNAGLNLGGILGDKTQDIALLYKEYYSFLSNNFTDKIILLNDFSDWLSKQNKIENCNFYFLDFSLINAIELRVITNLSKLENAVTIGVVCNENSDNKRIYPRFLKDYCAKIKSNIVFEECALPKDYSTDKAILLDNLYGYSTISDYKSNGDYSLRFAENIPLEVKGIAREIRREIVENGTRYKDIAILCPDINSYKKDIKRQFEIFEIPYFMECKNELESFAVVRLLTDAIACIESNFDSTKLLTFSKNILLDIDKDKINKFELYVQKYNIDGDKFVNNFTQGMGDAFYNDANFVRETILNLLDLIKCNKLDSSGDEVNKIYDFYNKVFENKSYEEYLNILLIKENVQTKQQAELAYNKLLDIIKSVQEMQNYCGDDIYKQILSIVHNAQIGVSKRHIDSVFITSNSKQIYAADILFIIGANDGVMVKESSEIALYTYSELERLEREGICFKPNIYDINYNEKFEAVQLSQQGKKVVISYNQATGEPSLFVKNIGELLNIKPSLLISDNNKIGMKICDYAVKIGTKTNAKQELSNYYSERMRGIATGDEEVFDYLYTKLQGEYKYQNLIKEKDFKYTKPNKLAWAKNGDKTFIGVSSIERYFSCPFKFYSERTLKLKPVQKGGMDSLIVGTFVHRILEKFFKKYKQFDMSKSELENISNTLCEQTLLEKDYQALALSTSKVVLQNSLFKKVSFILTKLVQVAKRSDFETAKTELTFGFDYSELPPYEINANGNSYFIRGKIDRIDKFGDYFAVIDYKSSSSVKYGLKEVYYGDRVQLLIYLNAVMAKAGYEPFALLYMPLPYTYNKEDKSGVFKYSGLLRNLDDAITHFDNGFGDKKISSISVSLSKEGEIKDKGLLSKEELLILREYADKVVAKAIEEIESGYIQAKPTSCDGCDFGLICLNKNNPLNMRTKCSSSSFSVTGENVQDGED